MRDLLAYEALENDPPMTRDEAESTPTFEAVLLRPAFGRGGIVGELRGAQVRRALGPFSGSVEEVIEELRRDVGVGLVQHHRVDGKALVLEVGPTRAQIVELLAEAHKAGDQAMAEICTAALELDEDAIIECDHVIFEAQRGNDGD